MKIVILLLGIMVSFSSYSSPHRYPNPKDTVKDSLADKYAMKSYECRNMKKGLSKQKQICLKEEKLRLKDLEIANLAQQLTQSYVTNDLSGFEKETAKFTAKVPKIKKQQSKILEDIRKLKYNKKY